MASYGKAWEDSFSAEPLIMKNQSFCLNCQGSHDANLCAHCKHGSSVNLTLKKVWGERPESPLTLFQLGAPSPRNSKIDSSHFIIHCPCHPVESEGMFSL